MKTGHNRSLAALALAAALALGAGAARGQDAGVDDLSGLDGATAAVGGGFAPGEVPMPTTPYQPAPEAQPQTQPAAASGDWYSNWQNWKAGLERKTGTSFELYLNPSDQLVVAGPGAGLNRGVMWYNFHIGQKLWQDAQLLMNTRGGEGNGVNRYVDSLFNFNQHAGEANEIYISHLFLEQKLFEKKLTLDAGKLDLLDFFDDNEVNGWNIIPYSLARNPSIPAPYHALGARARFDPTDLLYVEGGLADAGGTASQTGFNTAFDDDEAYFVIGEIGIKPKFLGRPGTYRTIFWYSSADIARFDGSGIQSNDIGFDLSCDQQVADRVGVSFRYGYSDPNIRRMNHYISVGMSYTEPIPGRKRDVLGASIAEVVLSEDYRHATPGIDPTATQVDVYYKIDIQPWIAVTPDVQFIVNPDADPTEDFAMIAGVYAELRF